MTLETKAMNCAAFPYHFPSFIIFSNARDLSSFSWLTVLSILFLISLKNPKKLWSANSPWRLNIFILLY